MSAIVIAENDFNETYLVALLDAIFGDDEFKSQLLAHLAQTVGNGDRYNVVFSSIVDFVTNRVGQHQGQIGCDALDRRAEWLAYRQEMEEKSDVYFQGSKSNPQAVWWPNPERYPDQYLDGLLPYASKLGLINQETAIGSAGSCFAWEISANLQARGFNYIVTEPELVPGGRDGIHTADVTFGDPPRSSANWGILFNTPSFRQIAEKAFGERELPRLINRLTQKLPSGQIQSYYVDPYREGVYFENVEAYEANYPNHIEASRQALLRSEYFVVTLGLNECWEYIPDGSVISRNPKELNFRFLLRPRVLSVEENIDNIQRFFDIVRAHNPDVNGGAKLVHPGGAKLVHLTLCGTRCWGVVPVVHRRDPRCFE